MKDNRINELYSTLSLNHANNINKDAFTDISKVLLSFHDKHNQSNIKEVCYAAPGHGKTSALVSYLKWITKQDNKQPILLATKDKHLAYDIYKQINYYSPLSIVNIDSDNKQTYEHDLSKYQIVIIQHKRLKDLALGYGNIHKYKSYKDNKRILIIDEKPDFVDSVIFDITSDNNVLEWFEELAKPLKLLPGQAQRFRSYIVFLLSEQLYQNTLDITTSLLGEFKNTTVTKNLLELLQQMRTHQDNQSKYDELNKLKHFEHLLKEDKYGRIDEYSYDKSGKKIIVSKLIDYGNLAMNILIFDGTAKANSLQYDKTGFYPIQIENRNDYSRLIYQIDEISTTKYSRNKKGRPTQVTIAKRIKELRKIHDDLFVLSMKDEQNIYFTEGAILEKDKHYYIENPIDHTKGINILNTIGKNVLNDRKSLYLTCLPKKNADYYKCIAIALYGSEINLMTNEERDNSNWFRDEKLEYIYRGELYSELIQIIHRTALRKIDSKEIIYIYIAYNDEVIKDIYQTFTVTPISYNLNRMFMKDQMVINKPHKLIDMQSYGRDKIIQQFAEQIKIKFNENNCDSLRISKVSKSFSKYIRNHWKDKSYLINEQFKLYGYKIIEHKDRYSDNSKYVIKI